MKQFLKLLFLLCLLSSLRIMADSRDQFASVLSLDHERPFVTSAQDCNGVFHGTVTDKPDLSTSRSNLRSVYLDASSTNYQLSSDTITSGITVSASFTLKPRDYSRPGTANVHFVDVAGNDTTVFFSYTPYQLTMVDASVSGVYPDSAIDIRIPIVNLSGAPIVVTSVELTGSDTQFTLDNATPKNFTMQKYDTVWVLVHFQSASSSAFSTTLRVRMGCDTNNAQSIAVRAQVGTLVFLVQDVRFDSVMVGTSKTMDVIALNNGTLAATLQSLSLKDGNQGFRLKNAASLPLSIPASQQMKVAEVEFSPTAVGPAQDNFSYVVPENHLGVVSTPIVNGNGTDQPAAVIENLSVAFRIAPNPVSSSLSIQAQPSAGQLSSIELYDTQGACIHAQQLHNVTQVSIPLNTLPNGIYLCRILTTNGVYSGHIAVLH